MRRNKVTIDAKTRIDKRGNTRKNGLSTKISVLNVLCTNALIGYIIYDEVYCCDVEWGGVGYVRQIDLHGENDQAKTF